MVFPVLRRIALLAVLAGLASVVTAAPALAPAPAGKRKPDHARSARFLPARLVADDAAQLERFRALAGGFRKDSTRHFTAKGRSLEVTQDLLAEMSAGISGAASRGRATPSGLAALLALRHGIGLKAGGGAHAAYVPDDKWYKASPQWGLHNEGLPVEGRQAASGVDMRIEKVWDRFAGSDSLVVAVLDAGFSFRHPELAGRHWVNPAEAKGRPGVDDDGNGYADDSTGWDFVDDDARPEDLNGHGTFISGVLAANFDDGKGIAGILAQGKVMVVRVLDASGAGDQNEIAEGIRYALRNGADVINFSIGGGGGNSALRSAFQAARDQGVPIVAAAGNEGADVDAVPNFPSSYDFENLVVVGAHGPSGEQSEFSNHGSRVHLAAPGEMVLTCGVPDRVESWRETFEAANAASRWSLSAGISIQPNPPAIGGSSLTWTSMAAVTATLADTVDLTGREGAVFGFELAYTPADASDILIVEGNQAGSTIWREIAVVAESVPAGTLLEFALRGLEGGKLRLRFRTNIGANRSVAARKLRIDGLYIATADPAPANREIYTMVDGTSIAAPHVAAYVALQRLACDRMGIPWSRARALEGTVSDPRLDGRNSTGSRLDAYKGLEFYLNTLPSLVVRDSTALSWVGGQRVEYALEVPGTASGSSYRFQASGLGTGLVLDTAAGKVSWTARSPGSYSLKLLAEGPTQLRRRLALRILPGGTAPVSGLHPPSATLRVGGRSYRLPVGEPTWPGKLEILGADGLGRIKILKSGWVDRESLAAPIALPAGPSYPFLRVRLNGADLPAGN